MTKIAVQIATKFALKFSFIGVEKKRKEILQAYLFQQKTICTRPPPKGKFHECSVGRKKKRVACKKKHSKYTCPEENFYQYRQEMFKKTVPTPDHPFHLL